MKNGCIAFLSLLFCTIGFAQREQNNVPKISAVGVGTTTAFPNAALITISFKHVKPTLREAINDNQATTAEVLKIVRKYVADTLDIKTSLIATGKSNRWDEKLNKDIFLGFESTQKLIFTLKDLKRMQDFTEELLKTKFNKIERITYFNTGAQELIKKAQELAVVDAIETTNRLAKASEVKTGKIIYMESDRSPNDSGNTRGNSYEFESYGKGMGGRGVTASGELIKYSVSVTVFTQIID
ncbi:SIMPL domain-containing protein [Flavobacterium sp. XGLA_31]|uniref:SIMPL domain-containing protein n=1 Tax=Flavobacterium sp. XGLA_31 TaxID=3447666 RepID=UPI003F3AAFCC